jgi:plasmid stabilization system protein ParE
VKAYRFGEEADLEFQGQIDYFAEHAPGVGERFIADVDAAIRDIRAHPEIGSPITKLIRKRVLRVFKYNILYINDPTENHRGSRPTKAEARILAKAPSRAQAMTHEASARPYVPEP